MLSRILPEARLRIMLPLLADGVYQNQYTDTGWFAVFITVLVCSFLLSNIYRSIQVTKKGGSLFIRKIAGLNAIEEAVGRATEMGKPVLMVPGIGSLDPVAVQALNIFSNITKIAAKFANPILLCCADAAVYTVAQEMIRDVYQSEGVPERFDPESVRFLTDRQFAFAAGVSGIILREQVAAAFFMGAFFAEALIFSETANAAGAIQIASSTQTTQTPFFIASCDYVLVGDEFYAASAYLTKQPVLTGSMVGQDWGKLLVASMIILGTLLNTYQGGLFSRKLIHSEKKHSETVLLSAPKPINKSDFFMNHLLTPQDDPSLATLIVRDKLPAEPKPGGN